jgi:ribosomal protein S6
VKRRYEGLFILNTAGQEENVKELIDAITAEIESAGGSVETVQKMDKRSFSRAPDKKVSSGFYVNFILEIEPTALAQLKARLTMKEDVYRVLFTSAPKRKAEPLPHTA